MMRFRLYCGSRLGLCFVSDGVLSELTECFCRVAAGGGNHHRKGVVSRERVAFSQFVVSITAFHNLAR